MPYALEALAAPLAGQTTVALDVGNSILKGGVFYGTTLRETFSIEAPARRNVASWWPTLAEHVEPSAYVGIASVVPAVRDLLVARLTDHLHHTPHVVSPTQPLPFRIGYQTPATLGMDRLAAVAGAWYAHRPFDDTAPASNISSNISPIISIDAGTAVTYDVLDTQGVFRGGPIGPGPRLIQEALHTGTAQLPLVALELPDGVISRSTQEALQAGLMYGFIDSVRGMLARLTEALGQSPYVVATGGWRSLLKAHIAAIHAVDAHLVLKGILALTRDPALARP